MSQRPDCLKNGVLAIGRKVGVYRGFDTENILLAILHKQQIPTAEVHIVDAASPEAFVQGEIQVFPSYLINEPLVMASKGIATRCLVPDDYGVSFYGDTLFTTERFWRQHRNRLVALVRASARGWEFARLHRNAALDIMFRSVRSMPREATTSTLQRGMLEEELRFLGAGPRNAPLYMERSRWNAMEELLKATGKLRTQGNVDALCDFDLVEEALK